MATHEHIAEERPHYALFLGCMVFLQMLPATLLVPTARPLFAELYPSQDAFVHAFMSVNMIGGFVAAPLLGWFTDRYGRRLVTFVGLGLVDALIQLVLPLGLPLYLLLTLRTLQGAAHVGSASLLLAAAASTSKRTGNGKIMGIAGSCLMFAVAFGSSLGGLLLKLGLEAPFWVGSGLALFAATLALLLPRGWWQLSRRTSARFSLIKDHPALWVPISSAFIGRFTVGCLVVTFALYAHRAFAMSDARIGFLYSLLTLPFAILMYPAARLGDHWPRRSVLVGGGMVYACTLGLLGRVDPAGLPWLMVLIGSSGALVFASTLCLAASEVGPERRGTSMALVNAAGCLGMLLGPAVAGGVSVALRYAGWDPVSVHRAVFSVAALSALFWLVPVALWARREASQRTALAAEV